MRSGQRHVASILQHGHRVRPTATALVEGDRALDFRATYAASAEFGARLVRAGVRSGSVVAVLARNSLTAALAYLGAWGIDAVVAGLNVRLTEGEIRRQLSILDPSVVVVDGDLQGLAAPSETTMQLDLDGGTDPDARGGRRLSTGGSAAAIFFTSGTTSDPKPVVVSHDGLIRNCSTVPPLLHLGEGDRYVLATPLCHIGGITRLLNALAAGAAVDLLRRWDPEVFAARVSAGGTHTMLIGPMITDLLDLGTTTAERLRRLRLVYYGAGRTDARALTGLVERYPGLSLAQGWGATETAGSVTMLTPEDHRRAFTISPELLASAGRALPGVELEIAVDGRIRVRGEGLSLGFLDEGGILPLVADDGALTTNDLGELDPEGYLFIRGRSDDAIRSGGLSVLPARVEEALLACPGVAAAAVVGAPDERLGERAVAFVVGTQLDIDAIREEARRRLAGFEVPRGLVVVDALPLTAAGKLDRRRLRALAAEVGRA
jgi:acyl-CoA synthetase (AMP-forming)/AMP-acid ligase II